ncbi:MAG: PIN domain nuclease [Chloroflexi bacterium]|nr:PIN domain nuclease [Chloroflexota bacterium]
MQDNNRQLKNRPKFKPRFKPTFKAKARYKSRSGIISGNAITAIVIGIMLSLIVSSLLILALGLNDLDGLWGQIAPYIVIVVIGLLGIFVMLRRGRGTIPMRLGGQDSLLHTKESQERHIILDTSAIIDGRIADISTTGFVQGSLLIPRFVLDELRHISDSSDPLRRNRGRRGLEMLSRLQKDSDIPIEILDIDFEDIQEVDAKLIKLGKNLRCPVLSNDFNLNKVAELQGVRVLNINELANAIKPVLLPGEEMAVRVIQEGRESNQGIGYLDDGTMIVVEGGKRFLDKQVNVVVARVLQTAAGRMIFAQIKSD